MHGFRRRREANNPDPSECGSDSPLWSNKTVSSFNPTCSIVFQENRFAGKSVKSVAVFGVVRLSKGPWSTSPSARSAAFPAPWRAAGEDDQIRTLALVVEVAGQVWG